MLGLELNLASDLTLMNAPKCFAENDGKAVSMVFGITKDGYKREGGNTIVAQIFLLKYGKKLNDMEASNIVEIYSSKPAVEMMELKNRKDKRLIALSHKIGNLEKSDRSTCKTFFGEIKDLSAPNSPREIKYLIQKDFYKTCHLKESNLIFVAGISFRTDPKIAKKVTQRSVSEELNKILSRFDFGNGELLSNELSN
jgi:hypothetical protein